MQSHLRVGLQHTVSGNRPSVSATATLMQRTPPLADAGTSASGPPLSTIGFGLATTPSECHFSYDQNPRRLQIPSPRPGLVSLLCHLPWGLPRGSALFFLCLTTLPLFFLEPTCARCSAPLLVTVIISPLTLGSHGQFSGLSSTVACLPGICACRC